MNYSHLLKKLDPWIGLVGTLVGVFGIFLSVVFYDRSRTDAEVKWFLKFDNVAYEIDEFEIDMAFEGKKLVPPVHLGTLILWNAGRGAIKQEDVRVPFGISLPANEASFFGAKIVRESSKVKSNFSLLQKSEGFEIQFRVLDPGMAVRVAILISSKDGRFGIEMTGADFGPNSTISSFEPPWWAQYAGAALGLFVALVFITFALLLLRMFRTSFIQFSRWQVYLVVGSIIAVQCAVALILYARVFSTLEYQLGTRPPLTALTYGSGSSDPVR